MTVASLLESDLEAMRQKLATAGNAPEDAAEMRARILESAATLWESHLVTLRLAADALAGDGDAQDALRRQDALRTAFRELADAPRSKLAGAAWQARFTEAKRAFEDAADRQAILVERLLRQTPPDRLAELTRAARRARVGGG